MWESREVGYPTVCQRDKNFGSRNVVGYLLVCRNGKNFGSRNVVVPLSMSKG